MPYRQTICVYCKNHMGYTNHGAENTQNFLRHPLPSVDAVVGMVEALCYKSEGSVFDSPSGHRNFSLT
jgi:hypothetical protein